MTEMQALVIGEIAKITATSAPISIELTRRVARNVMKNKSVTVFPAHFKMMAEDDGGTEVWFTHDFSIYVEQSIEQIKTLIERTEAPQ